MPTYDEDGALLVNLTGGGVLLDHQHSAAGDGGALAVGVTDTDATATRVFFAGTGGVLQVDAGFSYDSANDLIVMADGGGIGNSNTTARLEFDSSGATDYAYFSGANLGVGITVPTELLHIYGDNPEIRIQDSSTTGGDTFGAIRIGNTQGGGGTWSEAARIVMDDEGAETYLEITTTVSSRDLVLQTTGGDVGIGVTLLSGQLHIDQSDGSGNQPVLFLDQGDVSEQHIICSMDGADQDFPAVIELNVTGSPVLWWDESEDSWAFNRSLIVEAETALTSTQQDALVIQHNTSGAVAPAWFGSNIRFELEDGGGTENNPATEIKSVWASSSSPESGLLIFNTFDDGSVYGSIATWSGAVDGTARTALPGGTGDVTEVFRAGYVVARQAGAAGEVSGGTIAAIEPGAAAQTIYSNAGNIVQLTLAAGGDVTVQRTAGVGTYDVVLFMLWI